MDNFKKNSKYLIFGLFLVCSLAILFLLFIQSFPDGKLHLVFCDVGQGDGILIVTPSGKQVVIDGGPGDLILSCLGKNMPFYDKNIELMVLTHPQLDHMGGQIDIFKRFKVEKVIATNAVNDTPEYSAWLKEFKNEGSHNFIPSQNLKIKLDNNLTAIVLWPIDGNYNQTQPSDLNETSIVFRLEYGQFCALFTGDIGKDSQDILALANPQQECQLLKVPHHGSKNNISEGLWRQIMPRIAVISAGRKNRFGHPHKETIEALEKLGSRILRNDQQGVIEIVTDGEKIEIKN